MTIQRYYNVYKMLFKMHCKILSNYRADFLIGIACMLLSFCSVQFTLWAIFSKISSISGWSKSDIMFMYGFNLIVNGIVWMFFSNMWNLRDSLISGAFLKYKVRPINPVFYFFSEVFDLRSVSGLILGCATIYHVSQGLLIDWSISYVSTFIVLVFLSALLFAGLLLLGSSLGFWYNNSTPVLSFITQLSNISHFPLPIYNVIIVSVFSSIFPIGFITFYPSEVLLGHTLSFSFFLYMPFLSIGVFILSLKTWKLGIARYEGSGT